MFLASAVMISTLLSPAPGGELGRHRGMRRVRVQADDAAAGDTCPASRSRIPRGPQPRSIAVSRLQANPVQQLAVSSDSSSAWRCNRALSPGLLPSA